MKVPRVSSREGLGLKPVGFSLLELCLVLILIGFLAMIGFRYYIDTIEDSKESLVRFQGATFSRTVQNLYGEGKVRKSRQLQLDGVVIYLNENGWPASAGVRTSVRSTNQTPRECEALWHGVFKNAPGTVIAGSIEEDKAKIAKDFRISSIKGRICRYELARGENEQYFFDYDVTNGKVNIFSPKK